MQSRYIFLVVCLAIVAVSTFATEVEAPQNRPDGLCDVCRYVIENKQRRQVRLLL